VTISLFIACYNDALFPETGKAVVRLLESLGHKVEFLAAQTCCGQMHYNTGYHAEALALMRGFLEVFAGAEVICVPSASCVAMIREHYPKMAAASDDPDLQRKVSEVLPTVFEFTELLVDKLGAVDVGASFSHSVTFHTSCHSMRALSIGDKPLRLLRAVRGLELTELPHSDQCCGFGGTFAIKNPEVSSAMLSEKLQCVLDTGAEVCAAADNSCLLHIGGGLNRQKAPARCLHIAEILAPPEDSSETTSCR
jgi:L-lactate dehydrogenase complex protein LldE